MKSKKSKIQNLSLEKANLHNTNEELKEAMRNFFKEIEILKKNCKISEKFCNKLIVKTSKLKFQNHSYFNTLIKKEASRIPRISSKPYVGLDSLNTPNKSKIEANKNDNSLSKINNSIFQSKELETFLHLIQEFVEFIDSENPLIKFGMSDKNLNFDLQNNKNVSEDSITLISNGPEKCLLKMNKHIQNYEKSEDVASDEECIINCQNKLKDYSQKNKAKINHS